MGILRAASVLFWKHHVSVFPVAVCSWFAVQKKSKIRYVLWVSMKEMLKKKKSRLYRRGCLNMSCLCHWIQTCISPSPWTLKCSFRIYCDLCCSIPRVHIIFLHLFTQFLIQCPMFSLWSVSFSIITHPEMPLNTSCGLTDQGFFMMLCPSLPSLLALSHLCLTPVSSLSFSFLIQVLSWWPICPLVHSP